MRARILQNQSAAETWFKEGCHIIELSNSADDPDASIARARVAPGTATRLHRLDGVTERYLILQGEGRVEVGGLDAEAVRPGDVVLIPPGTPQRITNTGADDLAFLAICTPRFTPDCYLDLETNE